VAAFLGMGAWFRRRDDPAVGAELETIVRAMLTPA
jgi:hypothetical protein